MSALALPGRQAGASAHPVQSVAYLGPDGTMTARAVELTPALAAARRIPLPSVTHVVRAVETQDADEGVVPLENSIEGHVASTLDLLGASRSLQIIGELVLQVRLALLTPPGLGLHEVTEVISHPHALAECSEWLSRNIPGATMTSCGSTAVAAHRVAAEGGSAAAVAPPWLASRLGLAIAAGQIADRPVNETRFVRIGSHRPAPTGHDRTSIVCYQPADHPGSLLRILSAFSSRSINLLSLQSRPAKARLGEYCFFIDFEGHCSDSAVAGALAHLAADGSAIRLLGSHPRSRAALAPDGY